MISVDRAHVSLDGKEILHGISFEVSAGSIVGYVGPNGAGKTTTMRLLTGTLLPDAGRVLVGGRDIVTDALGVKQRIGYVPESGLIYESFSPREYLAFVGRMYGLSEALVKTRARALLRFWNLLDNEHQRMVTFSKGMKQKVLIAASVLHDPSVVLLDEPVNGLDAQAVLQFRAFLKTWALAGKTILYSSHILDAVEKIVSKVIIIRAGSIVAEGSPKDLMIATEAPTLELAFSSLTSTEDVEAKARSLMEEAFPEY